MDETNPTADLALRRNVGVRSVPGGFADYNITGDVDRITRNRSKNDRLITTHHQHDHR